MIKQFRFYVLDSVAEKIIGSFFASSDDMAVRVLRGFDVKKAKLTWDDIVVLKDPHAVSEYETVSELSSLNKRDIVKFDVSKIVQLDLDFDQKSEA